jgi:hypothetical protein
VCLRSGLTMLTPISAVGGVNSKLVCRDKDIFYLKENIVLHASLPDLSRSIVLGPSHHPCSMTSFDVSNNILAVAYRTVAGPLVELHQLSPSHAAIGTSSQINSIGGIEVCDVAFCNNGSRLAVLSSIPDFSVNVYDTATKQCLYSLNLVIPASRVSFSPVNSTHVLVHGSGIAQIIDFAASPLSIFRCEFVDGQSPLTAHSACFGMPPTPCSAACTTSQPTLQMTMAVYLSPLELDLLSALIPRVSNPT